MNEKELRLFYELCQNYRTTPITNFVGVQEAFDNLTLFVSERISKAERALTEIKDLKEQGSACGLRKAKEIAKKALE